MALVAVVLMAAAGAMARAPALSVSDTRPFGYFIGDAIHRDVRAARRAGRCARYGIAAAAGPAQLLARAEQR